MKGTPFRRLSGLALLVILLGQVLAGCSNKPETKPETEKEEKDRVVLYLFWGDGCPHCAAAEPVLEEFENKYPQLLIRRFEVWYQEPNQVLYGKMADHYQVPENNRGVPLLFLDKQYWIGWNGSIGKEIEAKVNSCIANSCEDAGAGIMPVASELNK